MSNDARRRRLPNRWRNESHDFAVNGSLKLVRGHRLR
jgi:hypothetical protein